MILRPWTHRIERCAVEAEAVCDAQCHARETAHDTKTRGTLHGPLPDFEAHPFGPGTGRMIHRVAAIFEKVVVQINFHRTRIGARAAKG